jgi:hypothetical protein
MPVDDVPSLLHDLVDVAATTPAPPRDRVGPTAAMSTRARLGRAWIRLTRPRDVQQRGSVVALRDRRR